MASVERQPAVVDREARPAGGAWRPVGRAFCLYAGVFSVLAWSWLTAADHAVPLSKIVHPADERVVPWILGWVAHALGTAPRHLMDANINHPAPGQLTGIEHFLSTQVLFAPLFWATGNAVLAANIVVLLTYPLGALAMERLVVSLGCRPAVAWVAGLIFALGPLRVPGNLMTLKYVNLYLPLVALALTRLRQQRTAAWAMGLAVAMTFALLSSYYLAVMVLMVAVVWGALEWLRHDPGRRRFALLAVAATCAAFVPFVLVSLPYLGNADSAQVEVRTSAGFLVSNAVAFYMYLTSPGALVIGLALLGLPFVRSSHPGVRRMARMGLAIALVGVIFMRGPQMRVGSWQVPLPFTLLASTPARFFQAPYRFVVVFGFGLTLLAAAALEGVSNRLGKRAGMLVAAGVTAGVLLTQGGRLAGARLDRFEGRHIHAAIAAVAGREGGPLLDLPLITLPAALGNPSHPAGTESDAMIGSTMHWLPLVTGVTNHLPPHRKLVDDRIARLPAGDALEDLIDMTHMRWVLLRPEAEWPFGQTKTRPALLASPRLRHALSVDGWELLRVEGDPRHAEWFGAIAAGVQPGRSVLGTRLEPLPEHAAIAEVLPAGQVPGIAHASRPLSIALRIRNLGAATWPVLLPPGAPSTYAVRLFVRWSHLGSPPEAPRVREVDLPRDLSSGDEVSMVAPVSPPRRPGPYELEIGVLQVDGARFDAAGNKPFRTRIALVAAAP